jgi:antitoxin ParD1/3/4
VYASLKKAALGMFVAYLEHVIEKYKVEHRVLTLTRGRCAVKLITLYVPETYLKALDQLVGSRFYPNRAEAIRVAIRDLVNDELFRRRADD